MDACTNACISIAAALGPFGELIVLAIAAAVAWFSRRQVATARTETKVAKVEAEAYKTAVLSIRPVPTDVASALRVPPLPPVRISMPTPDDEDTKP